MDSREYVTDVRRTRKISILISPALYAACRKHCAEQGISFGELCNRQLAAAVGYELRPSPPRSRLPD